MCIIYLYALGRKVNIYTFYTVQYKPHFPLQGHCDAKKIYQIEDNLKISASSKFQCLGNPDPHHFDADLDPAFHSEADPGPTLYSDADPDPDPPLLQNYHLRLTPFHFDAYPETAFHFDADEDPDLDPAFHFDADADPASQNDADPQHCQ
jgi:hypothetical protein